MKTVSGRQFARLLEERGWILMRIKGSHHIYAKSGRSERLSVPVHGNRSLTAGLLRHLMKLAGIDESEL